MYPPAAITMPVGPQTPFVQVLPSQLWVQVPQFAALVIRSKHCVPHWVKSPPHTHFPRLQSNPVPQGWSHPPQLFESLAVSTQLVPHMTCPASPHAVAPSVELVVASLVPPPVELSPRVVMVKTPPPSPVVSPREGGGVLVLLHAATDTKAVKNNPAPVAPLRALRARDKYNCPIA
jgi:hypothetical protein